ncbi:unnamed protein product [Pedinophyceae sp. YPF-701]|nr:unnamed protein product [Pedinophyceae sp. YPF-701]
MAAAALGPGDVPELFRCIQQVCGFDDAARKDAERVLSSLEGRPGYCSCLLELASRTDDRQVRWISIIQLKNIIARHWKPRQHAGGLSKDEKAHVRAGLMTLAREPDSQVAVQVALAIAKIARSDYPREWPSLFHDLSAALEQANAAHDHLAERRVHLVLHHALKELASKRLGPDQRAFHALSAELLPSLWPMWGAATAQLLGALPEALQDASRAGHAISWMERWLLLLKIVHRLLVAGFPADAKTRQEVAMVPACVPELLAATEALLARRRGTAGGNATPGGAGVSRQPAVLKLATMVDRGVYKLSKIMRDLVEVHPWSLRLHGGLAKVLAHAYERVLAGRPAGTASGSSGPQERALVMCLLVLHGAVTAKAYAVDDGKRLGAGSAGADDAARVAGMRADAMAQITGFLTQERKVGLLTALVHGYLPLTRADREALEDDPEQFHADGDAGEWRESLRPCAESLFLKLLESDRAALAPVVVEMLRAVSAEATPAQLEAAAAGGSGRGADHAREVEQLVARREGVYSAVGWGAHELHDYIDVRAWMDASLLREAALPGATLRPLRRRAVIVIGQWVGKLDGDMRPGVYSVLIAALSSGDPAISLAAVAALRAIIDDFGFEQDQFSPFVAPCLSALLSSMQTFARFDAQVQAFALICLVIERQGEDIRPHAGGLLEMLPQVWAEADGQPLLRMQVLVALGRLVSALGPASGQALPVVLPLLRVALDVTNDASLSLVEDGLLLWLLCLRTAMQPSWELLDVFPALRGVAESSTEHVHLACQCMQSCVLMGGAAFLRKHGGTLAAILDGLMASVNERGLLFVVPVIELVVKCFPDDGPALLEAPLMRALSSLLKSPESTLAANAIVGLFARIASHDPGAVLALVDHAARSGLQAPPMPGGGAAPTLLGALLDAWTESFDCLSSGSSRKLSALGLCSLLADPPGDVLQRVAEVSACVTSAYVQTEQQKAGDEADFGYDSMGAGAMWDMGGGGVLGALDAGQEAEGEFQRRKAVTESDPVLTMKVSERCRAALQAGLAGPRGDALRAAFQGMDAALAQQMHEIVQGG